MKSGIVVCSRVDSQRVPKKPLRLVNGTPLLSHLAARLKATGLPVVLAVPGADVSAYKPITAAWDLKVFAGAPADPLKRMARAAAAKGFDAVVRVCHDKVFVEPKQILRALEEFEARGLDYLYSSTFVDGASFEVISIGALSRAAMKFDKVEHISYAIHCVTEPHKRLDFDFGVRSQHRLLVDYPEDLEVLETVLASCGNKATLDEALAFLDKNPTISRINRTPMLTVYTCALNADRWVEKAMGSVAMQKGFGDFEYLLVDDFSTDRTPYLMSRFASSYSNTTFIRNSSNLGLASSSNVALARARGRYILRLDADDFFLSNSACQELVAAIEGAGVDAIYPDNWFGTIDLVQGGRERHHVGGSIFRTRAANHVRFTDGLRGLEGHDFFSRAKDVLKIGYLAKPMFFYRQRPGSLSDRTHEEEARLKAEIAWRHKLDVGCSL
jgi:spore coat polysaccharide biosynthesis protein SpsF (cytidylyltransferase family)